MAAFCEEFITGDDLEEIFSLLDAGFLEDEEEFIEDIESMVSAVANYEDNAHSSKYSYCSKLCKQKRGLSMDVNVKHAAQKEGSSTSTVGEPPSKSEEIDSKLKGIVEVCWKNIRWFVLPRRFQIKFLQRNIFNFWWGNKA